MDAEQDEEQAMLRLVQRLVAIRSVNGQDGEKAVVDCLLQEAGKLGLKGETFSVTEDRPNVVFSIGQGPPRFLFVAHLDTVAVGDTAKWNHPPFAGEVEDGRLYARGACDNKGGIVCALYTLLRLLKIDAENKKGGTKDWHLPCIQVAGVVDEESGACSNLGLKYLLESGISGWDGAIYTYPGRKITIGHRGLLRLKIEIYGHAIHSGVSEWCNKTKGANAVTALAEIIYLIENYDWPKDEHESFPGLSFTITPTIFNGGNFESIVPEKAEALLDSRLMPDTDPDKVLGIVQGIMDSVLAKRNAKRDAQLPDQEGQLLTGTINIKNKLPAAFIDRKHPLAEACSLAVQQVLHTTPEIGGCGPGNEGYMLIQADVPTICGFGPEGGNPHAANEWLGVASLTETVDIYVRVVLTLLHHPA